MTFIGYRARRLALALLVAAAPAVLAAARPMHLSLAKSSPADGSTVTSVPELRLWFSDAPMDMGANTVGIRIVGPDGKLIAAGNAARDPKDAKVYSLKFPRALDPRAYSVEWQAMAPDGDMARGRFGFTVAAP